MILAVVCVALMLVYVGYQLDRIADALEMKNRADRRRGRSVPE